MKTIIFPLINDLNTKKSVRARFSENVEKLKYRWIQEMIDYYEKNQKIHGRLLYIGGKRTKILSIGRGNKRTTKVYTQFN